MYRNHSYKKDSGKKVLARFSEIESIELLQAFDEDERQPAVIARDLILAWARCKVKKSLPTRRRFTDDAANLRRATDWVH